MDEYKQKLLEYISNNYNKVVKPAQGGPYIEIDLVPNGHNGLHEISEVLNYTKSNNIDILMFTRSYPLLTGDGIRMNRYWYFMQETTKQIIIDMRDLKINSINS